MTDAQDAAALSAEEATRYHAEIGKLVAETGKLNAETVKLQGMARETQAAVTVGGAEKNKGGRPRGATPPRQMLTLRLPADVIARWRDTGPGWQTRMAEHLAKVE